MQMGILSNWDTLTLGTNCQMAVTRRSLGTLYNNGENTTEDTHANGITL